MEPLAPGRRSPTRTFLILLAPILAVMALGQAVQPEVGEPWLVECDTNLDLIVEAQGARLARGAGYLSCDPWPAVLPEDSVPWQNSEHRCCGVCRGTWESLCDLESTVDPGIAQSCWEACVQRRLASEDTSSGDWPQACCAECGATRTSRCTVSETREASEVSACFESCRDGTGAEPPSCWWELGFQPGVSLRGQYQVARSPEGFEATCSIRRRSGEVLTFSRVGRIGASASGDSSPGSF